MIRLPRSLREAFKEPLGPVYTDAERLLAEVDGPLVAVGDVVTAHLLDAGRQPELSVVDGRTKREAVDPEIAATLDRLPEGRTVENPAAELSEALLAALVAAFEEGEGPTVIDVDGEEDLATLPVVLVAPVGASVVYGQPDEGMVHVRVTASTKRRMRELLAAFEGDVDGAMACLGVVD